MPSARKKCICQICTCGRHMCLHRSKDSHLVLGEDSLVEVNGDLFEPKESRRYHPKQWNLSNGETHEISATVDQINAQQVLANARSRATSRTVEDKGNSHASGSENRWSGKQQVPKRLPIRPPDNLKPGGETSFATVHQSDYVQRYFDENSNKNLPVYPTAAETRQESWNHRQIPKTQPIKNPDSLIFTGPFNEETTSKRDFNENAFLSKVAEGETTHRPRTSLKLSGEFQSDSSYQRAFTAKHAGDTVKVKKGTSVGHLKPEGDMIFDTTSTDYNAAVTEKTKWESENDRNIPLKPKTIKPQSGIKIPEVPLEDETTAVTDYRKWSVGKPERHKPADTFKLSDGTTDAEEYAASLSSRVYSDADEKVNDARWRVARPVVKKPPNNLRPEGNFNFATTNDVDYSSRRSRYSEPYLETLTERTERESTDTVAETELVPTEDRIVSTDRKQSINVIETQSPVGATHREPAAVVAENFKTDSSPRAISPPPQETEKESNVLQSAAYTQYETQKDDVDHTLQNGEMEYVTWDQIRPKPIRPHSNLRQEGGMEFTTTNRSEFIHKSSERVKGIRPKTTTRVSEGNFDATTMNQIMFSHDHAERVNPIRPKSNLHVENGHFADETTTAREYQKWEINRPPPIVHKASLMQEGSIDFTTTNKTEFEVKHPEKVYPIRPSTTNRISGDYELITTNQVMHGSYPIERVQKIVPQTNLRTSSGAMDFTTTNQMQFEGKQTEKVTQFRPHTSSKITGDFDGTTTNRTMYPVQPMQKPQMIKPRGNIEVEKASFAHDTTNSFEFQHWQGSKPQAVTPRNNLQQEGNIDFTTTNQLQYAGKTTERVAQIRPKSNPKITGEFDGTTTNQVMYQNIPGEKSKAVRPKTNIQLERGNFGGETTNNREFQTWGYEKPSPIKPHSSMRHEGAMDFTTTNSTQFEAKTTEKVTQIRPTTSTKITGDFDGTTTNQIMYQNNPVETVRGIRPSTNIHLETGKFEDQTTARREYQQWEVAKAEPIRPSGTLAQQGTMDFTTSNQREFGAKTITKAEQIRPHTSSPITGEFDGTTTNQVMYQAPLLEKTSDIRPRDNIRIQSGEFKNETTTSTEYGHKSGGKQDLIVPKPNLSQDGDHDFVTSNQLQYEEKTIDKVSQTRPKTHTKMSEGKFYGKTTNQAMFQVPEMETVHSVRPSTNLRIDEGTFQDNTTAKDAYSQWKTDRPKAFQLASSLKQEGDMTFETTNNSEFREKSFERVHQIRPKTSSKIEGDFEATTTNQAMYHQPEKQDRVKPIRQQNNLHLEHGKISGETTTNREYRQWVKKGYQIAVPKKKLQAAGIRTQGEKRSRRKETPRTQENEPKFTPKENEHEPWRIVDQSQEDTPDANNRMNFHEVAADNASTAEETKMSVTPREKSVTDMAPQEEVSVKESQEEIINEGIEKEEDISTMKADYLGKQSTTRVKSKAPLGHLRQKGDMNFTTTSDDYAQQVDTSDNRSQFSKSQEITMKGTKNKEATDNENYESWTLATGEESSRIRLSNATESVSQKARQEKQAYGITDKNQIHKAPNRYKPHDNLKIEHVPFNGTSTTQTEYKKLEGRRSSSKRRGENLKQEGKMQFDTTSNDYSVMRDHQLGREGTRSRIRDELKKGSLTPTGNMDFSTTSMTSYVGATSVARARNLRPRSSLRFGVADTSNQEMMSSSRSNPEISTRENYDLTSTSRASYVGYTGARTRANRPSTSQKVGGGAFDGQSTTRTTYTKPEKSTSKSETLKPKNHNILQTSNGFSGDTTYKSSFEDKKDHCPVIDLEAGRSQLTFNEEKNGHLFYAPRVKG